MEQNRRRRSRRLRRLVVISTLSAVVLIVSTFAWFIGMRTVNVSSFDIEIASTDSLLLSLDGETWDTTVSISQATLDDVSYTGHTNSWGGEGLFPVSSIGDMDSTVSRMKLFEKASLTATTGGYRLMASRVHNYEVGNTEQDGYVVFDLFVHNYSGTQYIAELNELDEEAIYLTTDSTVTVAADGVANTGIENSVRVAVTQIGRVNGTTTDASIITGITCTSDSNVTGICRNAQIWEPNDTAHVNNAISWYDTSCLVRTEEDVTLASSYSTSSCGAVVNGTAYPTYAVNTDITSADNVDVYDGAAYNTYTSSTELTAYDYFTDTEKLLTGTDRPTFITLEPNSITKLRIYIYIEGQDVDNYDYASIGKKITVAFGFTKERYTEDDVNYDGPTVTYGAEPDIVLLGDTIMTLVQGSTYTEPGAVATDEEDDDTTLTSAIVIAGDTVDTATPGTYIVTYNVIDSDTNAATEVTRTVHVIAADTTAPVITLLGEDTVTVALNSTYTDAGAIATDNVDDSAVLTNSIVTTSTVDTTQAGTYTVTYNVSDNASNAATEVTRTVIVTE